MAKFELILGAVLFVVFCGIANASAQRLVLPTYRPPTDGNLPIILPTYRPPVSSGPIIRTARQANEPQWLWKGDNIERAPSTADHPFLPSAIDDVKLDPNRRYVRSYDSPSAKGYGGGTRSSSGGRDSGPTHPGSNRRNARSIRAPDFDPFRPYDPRLPSPYDPRLPSPFDPFGPRPRGPYPIYARSPRDVQFPGVKKPSHRDVVIPNWNPHVRTNPWDSLGGRRKTRSLGNPGKEDETYPDYYDVIRRQ